MVHVINLENKKRKSPMKNIIKNLDILLKMIENLKEKILKDSLQSSFLLLSKIDNLFVNLSIEIGEMLEEETEKKYFKSGFRK